MRIRLARATATALRRLFAGSLTVLGIGCAAVQPDAAFDDVAAAVAERGGPPIEWIREAAAEHAVGARIREFVADGLTRDDAVAVALLGNGELQATYEELGLAQADLVEAGLLANPVLSAEIRFPGDPHPPFEIDVSQELLHFLTRPLRQRIGEVGLAAAKARVAAAVLELVAEVEKDFAEVQAAQQSFVLRRTDLDAAAARREAADRLHAAGNLTDLELVRERAGHEQARLDLVLAEAAAMEQRERLTRVLGLFGPEAGWRIEATLSDPPEIEVEPAGLESLAVARRPELEAMRHELEAQFHGVDLAHSLRWFGDVTGQAHYESEPDGVGTFGPSIDIPLPIFSQGQPELARGAGRLRQAMRRYAALAVQIRSEVRAARYGLLAAAARARHYAAVVRPLHERVLAEAQLRYNAMQIGVFDLLEAKRDALAVDRDAIEALRDYWVARADLVHAVGGALPSPETPTSAPAPRPAAPPSGHGGASAAPHHHVP